MAISFSDDMFSAVKGMPITVTLTRDATSVSTPASLIVRCSPSTDKAYQPSANQYDDHEELVSWTAGQSGTATATIPYFDSSEDIEYFTVSILGLTGDTLGDYSHAVVAVASSGTTVPDGQSNYLLLAPYIPVPTTGLLDLAPDTNLSVPFRVVAGDDSMLVNSTEVIIPKDGLYLFTATVSFQKNASAVVRRAFLSNNETGAVFAMQSAMFSRQFSDIPHSLNLSGAWYFNANTSISLVVQSSVDDAILVSDPRYLTLQVVSL